MFENGNHAVFKYHIKASDWLKLTTDLKETDDSALSLDWF